MLIWTMFGYQHVKQWKLSAAIPDAAEKVRQISFKKGRQEKAPRRERRTVSFLGSTIRHCTDSRRFGQKMWQRMTMTASKEWTE